MGMALTTVAELRSTLGVGTLYADATLQEVCDATDAVLLPMLWANTEFAIAKENTGTVGTLYFETSVENIYYIGQSIKVANAGSHFNGTKTITGVSNRSITITTSHLTDTPKQPINPYAVVTDGETQDWAEDKAVQQAALMISVEIWQARTATLSGSNAVDFQPSPYRMSAQLLAKVRGLIAHALSPNSMVG
jgi:hypothetical protein